MLLEFCALRYKFILDLALFEFIGSCKRTVVTVWPDTQYETIFCTKYLGSEEPAETLCGSDDKSGRHLKCSRGQRPHWPQGEVKYGAGVFKETRKILAIFCSQKLVLEYFGIFSALHNQWKRFTYYRQQTVTLDVN